MNTKHKTPRSLQQNITRLGWEFSWSEKLKLFGTGSPRMIYVEGLSAFDEIVNLNQSVNYTNLSLLRKGVLLTLHKKDQIRYHACDFASLQKVKIVTQKIKLHTKRGVVFRHQAEVFFVANEQSFKLLVTAPYYAAAMQFFKKSPIVTHCKHELHPEILESEFTDMNWIERLLEVFMG